MTKERIFGGPRSHHSSKHIFEESRVETAEEQEKGEPPRRTSSFVDKILEELEGKGEGDTRTDELKSILALIKDFLKKEQLGEPREDSSKTKIVEPETKEEFEKSKKSKPKIYEITNKFLDKEKVGEYDGEVEEPEKSEEPERSLETTEPKESDLKPITDLTNNFLKEEKREEPFSDQQKSYISLESKKSKETEKVVESGSLVDPDLKIISDATNNFLKTEKRGEIPLEGETISISSRDSQSLPSMKEKSISLEEHFESAKSIPEPKVPTDPSISTKSKESSDIRVPSKITSETKSGKSTGTLPKDTESSKTDSKVSASSRDPSVIEVPKNKPIEQNKIHYDTNEFIATEKRGHPSDNTVSKTRPDQSNESVKSKDTIPSEESKETVKSKETSPPEKSKESMQSKDSTPPEKSNASIKSKDTLPEKSIESVKSKGTTQSGKSKETVKSKDTSPPEKSKDSIKSKVITPPEKSKESVGTKGTTSPAESIKSKQSSPPEESKTSILSQAFGPPEESIIINPPEKSKDIIQSKDPTMSEKSKTSIISKDTTPKSTTLPAESKETIKSKVSTPPEKSKTSVKFEPEISKESIKSKDTAPPEKSKDSIKSIVSTPPEKSKESVKSKDLTPSEKSKASIKSKDTAPPQQSKESVKSKNPNPSEKSKTSIKSKNTAPPHQSKESVKSKNPTPSEKSKASIKSKDTSPKKSKGSVSTKATVESKQSIKSKDTKPPGKSKESIKPKVTTPESSPPEESKTSILSQVFGPPEESIIINPPEKSKDTIQSKDPTMSEKSKTSIISKNTTPKSTTSPAKSKESLQSKDPNQSGKSKASIKFKDDAPPEKSKDSIKSKVSTPPEKSKESVGTKGTTSPAESKETIISKNTTPPIEQSKIAYDTNEFIASEKRGQPSDNTGSKITKDKESSKTSLSDKSKDSIKSKVSMPPEKSKESVKSKDTTSPPKSKESVSIKGTSPAESKVSTLPEESKESKVSTLPEKSKESVSTKSTTSPVKSKETIKSKVSSPAGESNENIISKVSSSSKKSRDSLRSKVTIPPEKSLETITSKHSTSPQKSIEVFPKPEKPEQSRSSKETLEETLLQPGESKEKSETVSTAKDPSKSKSIEEVTKPPDKSKETITSIPKKSSTVVIQIDPSEKDIPIETDVTEEKQPSIKSTESIRTEIRVSIEVTKNSKGKLPSKSKELIFETPKLPSKTKEPKDEDAGETQPSKIPSGEKDSGVKRPPKKPSGSKDEKDKPPKPTKIPKKKSSIWELAVCEKCEAIRSELEILEKHRQEKLGKSSKMKVSSSTSTRGDVLKELLEQGHKHGASDIKIVKPRRTSEASVQVKGDDIAHTQSLDNQMSAVVSKEKFVASTPPDKQKGSSMTPDVISRGSDHRMSAVVSKEKLIAVPSPPKSKGSSSVKVADPNIITSQESDQMSAVLSNQKYAATISPKKSKEEKEDYLEYVTEAGTDKYRTPSIVSLTSKDSKEEPEEKNISLQESFRSATSIPEPKMPTETSLPEKSKETSDITVPTKIDSEAKSKVSTTDTVSKTTVSAKVPTETSLSKKSKLISDTKVPSKIISETKSGITTGTLPKDTEGSKATVSAKDPSEIEIPKNEPVEQNKISYDTNEFLASERRGDPLEDSQSQKVKSDVIINIEETKTSIPNKSQESIESKGTTSPALSKESVKSKSTTPPEKSVETIKSKATSLPEESKGSIRSKATTPQEKSKESVKSKSTSSPEDSKQSIKSNENTTTAPTISDSTTEQQIPQIIVTPPEESLRSKDTINTVKSAQESSTPVPKEKSTETMDSKTRTTEPSKSVDIKLITGEFIDSEKVDDKQTSIITIESGKKPSKEKAFSKEKYSWVSDRIGSIISSALEKKSKETIEEAMKDWQEADKRKYSEQSTKSPEKSETVVQVVQVARKEETASKEIFPNTPLDKSKESISITSKVTTSPQKSKEIFPKPEKVSSVELPKPTDKPDEPIISPKENIIVEQPTKISSLTVEKMTPLEKSPRHSSVDPPKTEKKRPSIKLSQIERDVIAEKHLTLIPEDTKEREALKKQIEKYEKEIKETEELLKEVRRQKGSEARSIQVDSFDFIPTKTVDITSTSEIEKMDSLPKGTTESYPELALSKKSIELVAELEKTLLSKTDTKDPSKSSVAKTPPHKSPVLSPKDGISNVEPPESKTSGITSSGTKVPDSKEDLNSPIGSRVNSKASVVKTPPQKSTEMSPKDGVSIIEPPESKTSGMTSSEIKVSDSKAPSKTSDIKSTSHKFPAVSPKDGISNVEPPESKTSGITSSEIKVPGSQAPSKTSDITSISRKSPEMSPKYGISNVELPESKTSGITSSEIKVPGSQAPSKTSDITSISRKSPEMSPKYGISNVELPESKTSGIPSSEIKVPGSQAPSKTSDITSTSHKSPEMSPKGGISNVELPESKTSGITSSEIKVPGSQAPSKTSDITSTSHKSPEMSPKDGISNVELPESKTSGIPSSETKVPGSKTHSKASDIRSSSIEASSKDGVLTIESSEAKTVNSSEIKVPEAKFDSQASGMKAPYNSPDMSPTDGISIKEPYVIKTTSITPSIIKILNSKGDLQSLVGSKALSKTSDIKSASHKSPEMSPKDGISITEPPESKTSGMTSSEIKVSDSKDVSKTSTIKSSETKNDSKVPEQSAEHSADSKVSVIEDSGTATSDLKRDMSHSLNEIPSSKIETIKSESKTSDITPETEIVKNTRQFLDAEKVGDTKSPDGLQSSAKIPDVKAASKASVIKTPEVEVGLEPTDIEAPDIVGLKTSEINMAPDSAPDVKTDVSGITAPSTKTELTTGIEIPDAKAGLKSSDSIESGLKKSDIKTPSVVSDLKSLESKAEGMKSDITLMVEPILKPLDVDPDLNKPDASIPSIKVDPDVGDVPKISEIKVPSLSTGLKTSDVSAGRKSPGIKTPKVSATSDIHTKKEPTSQTSTKVYTERPPKEELVDTSSGPKVVRSSAESVSSNILKKLTGRLSEIDKYGSPQVTTSGQSKLGMESEARGESSAEIVHDKAPKRIPHIASSHLAPLKLSDSNVKVKSEGTDEVESKTETTATEKEIGISSIDFKESKKSASSSSSEGGDKPVVVHKVMVHCPHLVCCKTLKLWAEWLKEVAQNTQKWSDWIHTIISQIKFFSEILKGKVKNPDGTARVLYKEEWDLFKNQLNKDVEEFIKYNTKVKELSENMMQRFMGKDVACCPACLKEKLIKRVDETHSVISTLGEALRTSEYWSDWLSSLVEQTKQIVDLPLDNLEPLPEGSTLESVSISQHSSIFSLLETAKRPTICVRSLQQLQKVCLCLQKLRRRTPEQLPPIFPPVETKPSVPPIKLCYRESSQQSRLPCFSRIPCPELSGRSCPGRQMQERLTSLRRIPCPELSGRPGLGNQRQHLPQQKPGWNPSDNRYQSTPDRVKPNFDTCRTCSCRKPSQVWQQYNQNRYANVPSSTRNLNNLSPTRPSPAENEPYPFKQYVSPISGQSINSRTKQNSTFKLTSNMFWQPPRQQFITIPDNVPIIPPIRRPKNNQCTCSNVSAPPKRPKQPSRDTETKKSKSKIKKRKNSKNA